MSRNMRVLTSSRVGCYQYTPVAGPLLTQLCLR
jgi:hypothetical protein